MSIFNLTTIDGVFISLLQNTIINCVNGGWVNGWNQYNGGKKGVEHEELDKKARGEERNGLHWGRARSQEHLSKNISLGRFSVHDHVLRKTTIQEIDRLCTEVPLEFSDLSVQDRKEKFYCHFCLLMMLRNLISK